MNRLNTKRHAPLEAAGGATRLRPLLPAGQRGDAPQASALLAAFQPRQVLSDAADDSDVIQSQSQSQRQAGRASTVANRTGTRKTWSDRQRCVRRCRIGPQLQERGRLGEDTQPDCVSVPG